MTEIYYQGRHPKWVEGIPSVEHRIRPGVGPLSLENICNIEIDKELPEAWCWDVEQVCDWLVGLGLQKYEIIFRNNNMVGKRLPVLSLELLQRLNIRILDDAMKILNGICALFNIRPEKRAHDPIERPTVDPRRQYFWYRRNFELPDRLRQGVPLTMMEWLYENGYCSKHYQYYNPKYTRWDNNKHFNRIPFMIGRTVPNSMARMIHMNEHMKFQYTKPFKVRKREDHLLWRELKRW